MPASEFNRWKEKYYEGKHGLFNLYSIVSVNPKNNKIRRHADIFQAEHESLAFNVYISWRWLKRKIDTLKKKLTAVKL